MIEGNDNIIDKLECGDGIPPLFILQNEPTGEQPVIEQDGGVGIRTFALGATIVGQLLIGLAITAGGNPLIGAIAAITIMICGLILVLAAATKPAR